MSKRLKTYFSVLILCVLAAACGEADPGDEPLPATKTQVIWTATNSPTAPPAMGRPLDEVEQTTAPAPSNTPEPQKPTRIVLPSQTPTATPFPTATEVQTQIAPIEPLTVQAVLLDLESSSNGPIYSLSWSPDGRQIAAAGFDRVTIWDASAGQKRAELDELSRFTWGVDWSPDGKMIAAASDDGYVRVWLADTTELVYAFQAMGAFCVSWSPDGSRLAAGTRSGEIYIWDTQGGEQVLTKQAAGFVVAIDWSPDGGLIATGELSGRVEIWAAASGELLKWFDGYTRARCDANGVAWSPDGQLLATAHQDGLVRVWELESGLLLRTLSRHTNWARGVAWSPDGQWVISTGGDRSVRMWDLETGQQLSIMNGHSMAVWSAAWSADGKWIATGEGAYEDSARAGALIIWQAP